MHIIFKLYIYDLLFHVTISLTSYLGRWFPLTCFGEPLSPSSGSHDEGGVSLLLTADVPAGATRLSNLTDVSRLPPAVRPLQNTTSCGGCHVGPLVSIRGLWSPLPGSNGLPHPALVFLVHYSQMHFQFLQKSVFLIK